MVLSHSGKQGHVDREEVEMIERVFELDDITVREVMVPRPDVVSVSEDLPLSEIRSVVLSEGHTRYPVVEADDQDQVVGFVDVKDVLRASESVDATGEPLTAGDIARELTVVPESTRVNDLLVEFQRDHSQMAAVIDEWGSLEGIATVEDVVEVVVGDIQDQFDEVEGEPSIDRRADGTYVVDGGVSLAAVNEALDADLESDEFGTLGGLVLDRLGRAPEVGDEVEADGYRLSVEGVDGARVTSIVIREPDETEPDETEPDETEPTE